MQNIAIDIDNTQIMPPIIVKSDSVEMAYP